MLNGKQRYGAIRKARLVTYSMAFASISDGTCMHGKAEVLSADLELPLDL